MEMILYKKASKYQKKENSLTPLYFGDKLSEIS